MGRLRAYRPMLVVAFFVAVIVAMLYPASVALGSYVIGRPFDDGFEYVWYLEWYKRALFDLQVSPLFQPDIFYPHGWDLSFAAFPPIHPTLFTPLTALIGPVATYNLLIVLTTLFTGLAVYGICRESGASTLASCFAGVAYIFYPQREMFFGGHMNFMFGGMWMVIAVYCLIRSTTASQHNMRWAALTGVAYGLSIGGSWHFIFLATVPLVILFIALHWRMLRTHFWFVIGKGVVLTALCLLIIGPFLYSAYRGSSSIETENLFGFQATNDSSVGLERFFAPSFLNPLVPEAARTIFPIRNGRDDLIYFGYTTMVLVAAWVVLSRHNRPDRRFVWVALVGFLLMLGPLLRVYTTIVSIPFPNAAALNAWLPNIMVGEGRIGIPMPALFLYDFLPPFRNFHGFGRWGIIAMLGLTPLAALALTQLKQRWRYGWIIGVVCIGTILLEFNLQPLLAVTPIANMQRGADQWLSQQAEQSTIVELPIHYSMNGSNLYYWLNHGQRMVQGAGSIQTPAFRALQDALLSWPEQPAFDQIAALDVDYVLVDVFATDTTFEDEQLPQLLEHPQLSLINRFPHHDGVIRDVYIFEFHK